MTLKKACSLFLLMAVAGVLAGCGSMGSVRESVKARFAPMPPKEHIVKGDMPQVYAAVKLTMARFGYQQTGGGPAEKMLEGISRIEKSAADFGSSRQRTIDIHLQPLDGGMIAVKVLLKEVIEEEFTRATNPATATTVRDSTPYEVFFDELDRQMQVPVSK